MANTNIQAADITPTLSHRLLLAPGATGLIGKATVSDIAALLCGTPYVSGSSGDGTDASPFTDPDNTGGIQTALDALTEGGRVYLANKKYTLTAAVSVKKDNLEITGDAPSMPTEPNAFIESPRGNKIRTSRVAIKMQSTLGKFVGFKLNNVGFYCPFGTVANQYEDWANNPTTATVGVVVQGNCGDQSKFEHLHFGNFGCGIYAAPGSGMDSPTFEFINTCSTAAGIVFLGEAIFVSIKRSLLSDGLHWGVFFQPGVNSFNNSVEDCIFARNVGSPETYAPLTALGVRGAVFLGSDSSSVTNCKFVGMGQTWFQTAGGTFNNGLNTSGAWGIISAGANNIMRGNFFKNVNPQGASGIWVQAVAKNMICDNHFTGLITAIRVDGSSSGALIGANTYVSNTTDVLIDAGAANTEVTLVKGMKVTNNGTGTIYYNSALIGAGLVTITGTNASPVLA